MTFNEGHYGTFESTLEAAHELQRQVTDPRSILNISKFKSMHVEKVIIAVTPAEGGQIEGIEEDNADSDSSSNDFASMPISFETPIQKAVTPRVKRTHIIAQLILHPSRATEVVWISLRV